MQEGCHFSLSPHVTWKCCKQCVASSSLCCYCSIIKPDTSIYNVNIHTQSKWMLYQWICLPCDWFVVTTGAVPAMKPEATTIGDPQDGHWKITLTFDGRRFCIQKFRYSTLQQTSVTSLMISDHVLDHRIGLLLTRAVRHLAVQPFGSDWWLHRPRLVGWLVRYLDIYLFCVYGCN